MSFLSHDRLICCVHHSQALQQCKIQLGSTVSQPPNVGVVQVLSHNAGAAPARSATNFEAGTNPTGTQFRVPISVHRKAINGRT